MLHAAGHKQEKSGTPMAVWLALAVFLAGCSYLFAKISDIHGTMNYIAQETVKVRSTRAALGGTTCIQCHGTDSGIMLPLRPSLNSGQFITWVRGTRLGAGYQNCPPLGPEKISDAELKKIHAILYKQ
jgi:hypothetical protein